MSVLRVRRCGFVVFFSLLMAACSGSSDFVTDPGAADPSEPAAPPAPTAPVSVSGSVGDGPVVGADLVVTDANGQVLDRSTSDELASYALDLPGDTALPVLVEATGGVDLVTGRALDFTLLGAVLETGEVTVNISPLTTVAVRAAQCMAGGLTRDNLTLAWERIHDSLAMGLDPALIPDPMREPVTPANVEAVVLANEALGETVRRADRALKGAGLTVAPDALLEQAACALVDDPEAPAATVADPRVLTTFKSAELAVRLETLAGRLEVDGQPANERMNDAIRLVEPALADPSVADVPVTEAARDQTVALLTVYQTTTTEAALVTLAETLASADPAEVAGRVDAALSTSLQNDLDAMTTNLALADETVIEELERRRLEQQAAPAPVVSFAADPSSVDYGAATSLSWASSNADRCVASGGWQGDVGVEGARRTEALMASTRFELTCAGVGGTTTRTVDVLVAGEPVPDPLPTLSLSASSTSVASGDWTRLSWSAEDAESCIASGDWSTSKSLSGYQWVGPISEQSTYRLRCEGAGGSVTRSVTISVAEVPEPSLTISAADTSINEGDSAEISWSAANVDSCGASGDWSGSRSSSGTESIGPLSADATFRLTCTGVGGSITRSVSVSVAAQAAPAPAPAPAVSLTAGATLVAAGDATQLSWSATDADTCTASGAWSGSKATTGSQSTGNLNGSATFNLTCTGPGGSGSDSVTVAIAAQPSVNLSAADAVVPKGGSTQLSWSSSNAESCSASADWSGAKATSGSQSVGPINAKATFTLTCSNGVGQNAATTISVAVNDSLILSWQTPTENVDGTALTDLAGFKLYYGTSSGSYSDSLNIAGPSTTSYTLTLPSGEYYFAMTALDDDGNESGYSNEVVRTVD